MFERRLKVFLIVIFLIGVVLIGRLFAVQVVNHMYWSKLAAGLLTKPITTETTRGQILDFKGSVLATDIACTDACVDYRAIIDPPDPKWITATASERLIARLGTEYRATKLDKRKAMLAEESEHVKSEITTMWATLAQLNPEIIGDAHADAGAAMIEIRRKIVQSVQGRRQWLSNRNQERDKEKANSAWVRLLAGSADPNADNVGILAEETEPHVVLPALDSDACNFLGKRLEQFPGLVLRASTHRKYPAKTVACQLLGRLSRVSAADLDQAKRDNLDEFKQYTANDLIGREGIEALCEPLLRGSRGRIDIRIADHTEIARQDFVPGVDVQLSIDSDLQKQVENMLSQVVETDGHGQLLTPPEGVSMHAAAVVLDVKTNELRVLASNPGFDVNDLQTHYKAIIGDTLDEPLRNRATSDECGIHHQASDWTRGNHAGNSRPHRYDRMHRVSVSAGDWARWQNASRQDAARALLGAQRVRRLSERARDGWRPSSNSPEQAASDWVSNLR
jgi:cell division protein FtsI/penicillin-binding protein 2